MKDKGKISSSNQTRSSLFFINHAVRVRLHIPIKDRVKILLRRKGISQNKLADRVGINKGTMSQIVNGLWTPASQIMLRIAEELDCDSVVIFGDTEYWKEWRAKLGYPNDEQEK